MVMNKKEKKLVESLKVLLALRRTEEVLPDVDPPSNAGRFGELSTGYTFNAYSLKVSPACSSSISHGIGRTDKTSRQEPKKLYSTKELATRAMRYEVEMRSAKELHKVDLRIQEILGFNLTHVTTRANDNGGEWNAEVSFSTED